VPELYGLVEIEHQIEELSGCPIAPHCGASAYAALGTAVGPGN
jgi:hypothetical protein